MATSAFAHTACTQRKAAEISLSVGSKSAFSRKRENESSESFFARAHLCACAKSRRAAPPQAEISVLALPLQAAAFHRGAPQGPRCERAGASARPQAARPRGAACVACRRRPLGHQRQPQGGSVLAHAAGFSRSHACTHRKAAEEVIFLSMGSK